MKLILFIRKAKLIQFMAKLDEVLYLILLMLSLGSWLIVGKHVTLGLNEKENLKAVIDYLRDDGNVSMIRTFKTWNS
ncbi:hypothetical protein WN943_023664 [Citrus x changshan-huyou]